MTKIILTTLILSALMYSAVTQDSNSLSQTPGVNWCKIVRDCRQWYMDGSPASSDYVDQFGGLGKIDMKPYAECLWSFAHIMPGGTFDEQKISDFLQYDFSHMAAYSQIQAIFKSCVAYASLKSPANRALHLYRCLDETEISKPMRIHIFN